ncbi:MAG: MFS transporter [Clostridiales Family XIII bacterium]|nr:MFS transporter [Clostridia bacterium]MDE8732399.1 MFS transporter [Eubacteriales bacterium DFI.9.88]MDY3012860.1 MFS transporter [Clostridiales Family XIII bacterium]
MDINLVKKSRRRAWLVVTAGFFTYFFIYGSAFNCFGLFLTPMTETLGVSRTIISSLFTIELLVAIPGALIFGRIADKRDLKWPMAICCALVGIGYIMYATVTSVALLYIAAGLIGIGIAGTIQIPAAIFIDGWFIKRKGFAMGVTMVGSGVGGTILSQVLTRVIQSSGWEAAYFGLGAAIIVITVPLTLAFVTKTPHTKNMLRYGEEDEAYIEKLKASEYAASEKEGDIREIMRKPEFWVLFIGVFCFMLPMGAIKGHVVAYLGDLGYSPQLAANILTIMVFTVIPGKPCTGIFYDKLDSRIATAICGVCMAGGLFFSLGAGAGIIFAIAFAAIYGFGSAMASVGIPLVLKDTVYMGSNFALVFSIINIAFNVATAFGPTIMAMIQESTGSYALALLLSAIIIAIGYLACIIALTMSKRRKRQSRKHNFCN